MLSLQKYLKDMQMSPLERDKQNNCGSSNTVIEEALQSGGDTWLSFLLASRVFFYCSLARCNPESGPASVAERGVGTMDFLEK